MDKQEKKFREFFQDPNIQFDMRRLDKAGVSAVQRATAIMALRRMFNTYVTMNMKGHDLRLNKHDEGFTNHSFQHHVDAVIKEMEVAQ
ncbi:MAG: hypothetical protein Unbinned834contig1000_52 [Prokaryotic dsDNA virus sp.]|nr:MAG: hypothetical protein Unbinned834contig1000_52 [Prokaryotic dsDNA virus sp.]|tara:strand:- start:28462 stop:28725 length:264 start_codon:yes stop_codon:yes gene_type:complete